MKTHPVLGDRVTAEQVITLRLEDIERALSAQSLHAVADQPSRRVIVVPQHEGDYADAQDLWHRVVAAPVIQLSDEEILSDRYIEIALSRAAMLFCASRV
jgi:hypothetical protein